MTSLNVSQNMTEMREQMYPSFPSNEDKIGNFTPKLTSLSSSNSSTKFYTFIRNVQKILIYETKSWFYLIGSNPPQSKFRVLKIDRTEAKKLNVWDDGILYGQREINALLKMIADGNRFKTGQKMGHGLTKTTSAYGLVGFVQFLEGYYMILITSRRKVAHIGHHSVYKIEDTIMIYLPNDEVRESHSEEQRYLKIFQNVDLSSNFYYSYSYDLTHTFQYNIEPPSIIVHNNSSQTFESLFSNNKVPSHMGYLSLPSERFTWNKYLMDSIKDRVHHDWNLNIIHGFIDHVNISIFGTPILCTLIARRSNKFAGTRFLKRGANFKGDVANEVEIEQIVSNSSISSFEKADITSFVQLRGSIPAHWSQDSARIGPKPQIYIELNDPKAITAGRHFNDLMKRFGAPIICFNLVKREKKSKKHESVIGDELVKAITYLNQFVPKIGHIQYVHFDMAKCKKSTNQDVMSGLHDVAYRAVAKTGIYHNYQHHYWNQNPPYSKFSDVLSAIHSNSKDKDEIGTKQTGVIRTNCVDCLDRTTTAQFVIGKCALALQLFALGFLQVPYFEHETDVGRMLEGLYEDLGDTLALQYGGSQLIHRIKSYRKNANKWTNKANDITQTLRRYYSNTLSDTDKQMAINLFLGVFVPKRGKPPIWNKEAYPSDVLLHLPELTKSIYENKLLDRFTTQWWDIRLKQSWPLPLLKGLKPCTRILQYIENDDKFDLFNDYYLPSNLTVMTLDFTYSKVSHSVRDYMPNCSTNYSPFVLRDREGKRQEEVSHEKKTLYLLLSSLSSRKRSQEEDEEDEDYEDYDEDSDSELDSPEFDTIGFSDDLTFDTRTSAHKEINNLSFSSSSTFDSLFPSSKDVYGFDFEVDAKEIEFYNQYLSSSFESHIIVNDDSQNLMSIEPIVSLSDYNLYVHHMEIASHGITTVAPEDEIVYKDYILMKNLLS